MASIKRRKDSEIWVACFTLPNGTRKQVSTHTTDEKEAMQIALSYEKAGSLARQKRLTDTSARRVVREIAASAGYALAGSDLRLGEFLDQQWNVFGTKYRGRTLERYRHALKNLRENCALASRPLTEFTRNDAADWRDKLIADALSPRTVNHQLGVVQAVFQEAATRGIIEGNPFLGVKLKNSRKSQQQREPFTFEQFADLVTTLGLADCPVEHAAEWRLLVLLAGYTGQRKSDCVGLKAETVNMRRGVIGFWRSKNNDWHEVPLHPALARELAPVVTRIDGAGALFPNLAALPPRGRNSISDQFRLKVLPLVGIVQPYMKPELGQRRRNLAKLSFHSLRHSLSSWLNAAGVSDVDRMALVGHDDAQVSRGYTHAGLENAKRAIALIPEATRPDASPAMPQDHASSPSDSPSSRAAPAA